jgi:hypothetical protein
MVWMLLGLGVSGRSRPPVTATLLVKGSTFSSHTLSQELFGAEGGCCGFHEGLEQGRVLWARG